MVLPWFMLRVRDLMNLDCPVCSPQSEVLCTHFLGWPVCSPLSEVLCTHLLDLACVFPSVRGIMHTSACPFFELILRVRDMSSGTFLVGPGIVTVPFVLAFLTIRVLACSFKMLCQCRQYHGLKHGPEIWVITELCRFSVGVLDLI